MFTCFRRLPLDGLLNARDLGGHPVRSGGVTKYGAFIRCEAPVHLSERDLDFLKAFGVKTAVDFRGDAEVERQPSVFESVDWVDYHRCPTFNSQVAFGSSSASNRPALTSFVQWGEKYIEMSETCMDWVRAVLEAMAGSMNAVIFNCTTGKDRTGIISALLLGLAGVSDEDIIADYCVSQVYLRPVYEELIKSFKTMWPSERAELDDPFFRTDPENMALLLAHLGDKYGGIEEYIRTCGIKEASIKALRARLTA